MPVNGIMQLVLNLGKEFPGGWRFLVVIHAGGIDVGDFLVETSLAESDFPYFFE